MEKMITKIKRKNVDLEVVYHSGGPVEIIGFIADRLFRVELNHRETAKLKMFFDNLNNIPNWP